MIGPFPSHHLSYGNKEGGIDSWWILEAIAKAKKARHLSTLRSPVKGTLMMVPNKSRLNYQFACFKHSLQCELIVL